MLVKVCKTTELKDGEMNRFDIGEMSVLVARAGDRYFVTEYSCTHEEADLSLGLFSEGTITCPLHQAKFEILTGAALEGPNGENPNSIRSLRVYATKVENEILWAEIP